MSAAHRTPGVVSAPSLLGIGHTGGVEGSLAVLLVVLVAGIGTGVLFGVSLLAYVRRRTTQYLLVCLAVGALWARSIVGAGTVLGYVPMTIHHLVEHSLDFCIAAVVLYAVYAHAPGTLGDAREPR